MDWPESVKLMQRNWIGRSTGAHIDFACRPDTAIRVFTTRPDTLFGATYMVAGARARAGRRAGAGRLAGRHPASVDRRARDPARGGRGLPRVRGRQDRGRAHGRGQGEDRRLHRRVRHQPGQRRADPGLHRRLRAGRATAPARSWPCPAQDERDWEFAEVFDLPIIRTVQPTEGFDGKAYTGDGPAINSATRRRPEPGRPGRRPTRRRTIIDWLEANGHGAGAVTYRLRDWLFSRQRYWGEPFPIVYDETGLPIALPESMLPVELPEIDDFSPKTFDPDDADSAPETPLSRAREWVEVELDLGDGPKRYRRETNTMPQWAGSCWYELRYLDPTNDEAFVDPANERYWMGPQAAADCGGVDLYVGGVEHAVLHLLYARFWHKVLFDLGHVSSFEPFRRLFNQGYIQAYAYTDARGVLRAGGGGRRARRRLLLRRPAGQPRVRQDGQVAEERGHARTRCARPTAPTRSGSTRCRWVRWTCRGRGRPARSSARSGSCSGSGAWSSTRDRGSRASDDGAVDAGHRAAAAPGDRRRPRRHGGAAVQHRDRQADRADQPGDLGRRPDDAAGAGRAAGADDRAVRAAPRRGAVAAAGPRRVAGLRRRSRSPTRRCWSTTR